jgi:hypothetical protein
VLDQVRVGKLEQRRCRCGEAATAQHDGVERPAEVVLADLDRAQVPVRCDGVGRQDGDADAGTDERRGRVDAADFSGDLPSRGWPFAVRDSNPGPVD